MQTSASHPGFSHDGFVVVRGARQHNLKNIDVEIPRDAFVVFTGVSGSGKSSLAFGTIYAEAQRRYFDSINPYARRLITQLSAPLVSEIHGLPPAVAFQQRRIDPTTRSSVGTLTRLSNSLRMLFSRAGTYPTDAPQRLDSDAFSTNTITGACETCHGIGVVHTVTEQSLVPDPSLTIRDRAIAAWPGAWQGKNYRDILAVLGYDVDRPWKELSQKDRDWILFTDERPVVTVHAEREAHRIQRPYQGTYVSAASYVRHTFATTNSATLRKRVAQFMTASLCEGCKGKRLKASSLAVKFGGYDIAELAQAPLSELSRILAAADMRSSKKHKATDEAAHLIVQELIDKIGLLTELGLDYLSLDRSAPTLSAGELQRLRLVTQLRSGLFGVVYVLDEPSAGLHPADTDALIKMLRALKSTGNSLFVVDHEMDIIRQADWIVDMGPAAGEGGGHLIYSGLVEGLAETEESLTRRFLFPSPKNQMREPRSASGWLKLSGIDKHNLKNLSVEFPLGVLTAITGISGSGKSTLVSHVLAETLASNLGINAGPNEESDDNETSDESDTELELPGDPPAYLSGHESIKRMICVDQKPIGRTPRSNLATYTGLFDAIRKSYAALPESKKRGFNASRFSFNVTGGRCETCEGEGFVSVELLFLPSVYAPCSTCQGSRYNTDTLDIEYKGMNIAQVLDMTVDAARAFFNEAPSIKRALTTLQDVGLGYLRLGQPATELSGGEAQRIKLATELQRVQAGSSLYILDEPTTGLHPADVEKLMKLLHDLVDAGNTVIIVEHDMDVIAAADWVIDLGPGAGKNGGQIVASGPPIKVAGCTKSRTAEYLRQRIQVSDNLCRKGSKKR